jgi:hypothetical protein
MRSRLELFELVSYLQSRLPWSLPCYGVFRHVRGNAVIAAVAGMAMVKSAVLIALLLPV